VGSEVSKLYII